MKHVTRIALALLLAGCTSSSPSQTYRLEAKLVPASCRGASGIAVRLPQAAPGLDSDHIAVIDRPQHLSYYRGVAWTAPLPTMLQAYFVEAFAQSQRFSGVTNESEAVPARWAFDSAVRHFEVDQSADRRTLKLQMVFRLRPAGSRQITVQETLGDEIDVSGKSIDEMVQQMNQSLDGLTQQFLQKVGCR